MAQETPSTTMYADLRGFGGITNRDAARILLSSRTYAGGKAPRDRVDDRTFLSREVVHAAPGSARRGLFADFSVSSQTIASQIASNLACPDARERIVSHYRDEAATAMRKTLEECGLDATLYRNAVERIASVPLRSEGDRATLFLMLFLVTGCLADPQAGAAEVEAFVAGKLSATLQTVETDVKRDAGDDAATSDPEDGEDVRLGLLRIIDGAVRPPLHPLSTDPEGTVIGSLPTGANVISDVDQDVSRRHLVICREGGRWLARGLGSTNGTWLVSGTDRLPQTVEEPRATRLAKRGEARPVEIHNSDTLLLGATTRFLVMRVTP